MLQRLVLLKQPIQLYLEDSMPERERASFDLSDVEWVMAKSVLTLLESVDGVTTTLSGEKYSMLSWCLPLLFGLRDAAKCDGHDCMTLAGIKKKLTSELNRRFQLDSLKMDSPLVLAAALDPHFRKLTFFSDEEQDTVYGVLVEKASALECSCSSAGTSDEPSPPPVKKKKPNVLDRLLGEEVDRDDENTSVSEEITLFMQERPIKRKEYPLSWWRGNAIRFPHLAILARRYLAIPATSTASDRVFSVAGIVVDKRWCALTVEMIDALVFLHKNSHLFSLTSELPVCPKPKLILQTQDNEDMKESDESDDNEMDEDLPLPEDTVETDV